VSINIYNKKESLQFIKDQKLNHFGEVIIKKGDIETVNHFINENPVEYYYLREFIPGTKNVFYTLSKDEVYSKIDLYDIFGLDVSSENYINNIKLVGEIYYSSNNTLIFSGSTNPKSNHRNFLFPNYFFETDIFDRRIKKIPYIEEAIDYIYKHNLFDYIIEFVVFDIKVGVFKENIIIYEIRNRY
jgi:hypothetical protein